MNRSDLYDSATLELAPVSARLADSELLQRLQQKLLSMPPVRAMNLRVESYVAGELCLFAPLADNVNDKHCAFGGSLAGLMTLACWGSASLLLSSASFADAEVYVQDSQVKYLAPLYTDLRARAQLAAEQQSDEFVRCFRERGKARVSLRAEIRCADGRLAASLEGRFVALRPSH